MQDSNSNNALSNEEKYIQHCIGGTAFLSWMMLWNNQYKSYQIEEGAIISLDLNASSRFGILTPIRKVYGVEPFLVVQKEELSWFDEIVWDRVVIKKNVPKIYFVAKKITTEDNILKNLPSFSFAIQFHDYDLISNLIKFKNLGYRNIWFDEEGEAHIPRGKNKKNIPLFIQEENSNVLSEYEASQTYSLQDELFRELKLLEGKFGNKQVEFIGDKPIFEEKELQDIYNNQIARVDNSKPKEKKRKSID